ncbi:hypothetical protein B0H10DRAFT_1947286 [Mycena sp. CBHHK59/15]|nr:hypothetical protein B0H10DRAFT_1947286 [Mycena sp. CBHHK59/15]
MSDSRNLTTIILQPSQVAVTGSQAEFEDLLLHHFKSALGCQVEMGKRLSGITQDADRVTALENLIDGLSETIEYDFLVGSFPFIGEPRRPTVLALMGGLHKNCLVYPAPLFQLQDLGPTMQKDVLSDVASLQQKFFNSITVQEDIVFNEVRCIISQWN